MKGRYNFTFSCNAPARHWRDRAASWLRRLATLLDGRKTLAIEMHSMPSIPQAVEVEVVTKGLEHMRRLFANSVENECIETLLKQVAPDVFDA